MIRVIFFLLLASCHADFFNPTPQDKEPSAIVDGLVNVVTGDFIAQETFGYVKGSVPYSIESSFCPSLYTTAGVFTGWSENNHASIFHCKNKSELSGREFNVFEYEGSFGQHTKFSFKGKVHSKTILEPDSTHLKLGSTNLSGSEISGRSNSKNLRLAAEIHTKTRELELTSGSGLKVKFNILGDYSIKTAVYRYDLSEINYPNGFKLKDDILYNRESKAFASYTFETLKNTEKTLIFHNTLSDGKVFNEHYIKSFNYALLTILERSFAPQVTYSYDLDTFRIVKRELPCNRYVLCNYYQKKEKSPFLEGKSETCEGRIKSIFQPAGRDGARIATHTLQYHFKEGNGCSKIQNAFGHQTLYHVKNYRLSQIQHFKDDNQSTYRFDNLYWGEEGSSKEGNLIAKTISDEKGEHRFVHEYHYDKRGNPVFEWQFGNFTGKSTGPISFNGKGRVTNANFERREVIREYSEDKNLLKKEFDWRKYTHLDYVAGTDLVKSKFNVIFDVIKERTFLEYGPNNDVTQEILDNGTTGNLKDLKGATFRQIKKYQNNAMGLPLVEELFYYDFDNGKELFFGKKVNTLDRHGNLIRQEFYDTENTLTKTLLREYDAHDNCTLEIDPQGNQTKFHYDPLDNLVLEEGPLPGHTSKYAYDFMNRLIRKEVFKGEEIFTTHYAYDILGRLVSEIDPNGHETKNIYDSNGNLIEKILPAAQNGQAFLKMKYNFLGQCISVTDPLGNETITEYTVDGLPYHKIYPDGTEERWVYNLFQEIVEHTATNGLITTYERDYKGRVIKETGAGVKTFEYDHFNLIASTDESGLITRFKYDAANRLIETVKEDSHVVFDYDPSGRVKRKIQSGIRAEVFEYDFMDRVIEERTESLSGEIFSLKTMTYDQYGRLIKETIGDSSTYNQYNSKGEIAQIINPNGDSLYFNMEPHFLNHNGLRVIKKTVTDSLGGVSETIFDPFGKIEEEIKKNSFGEILQETLIRYDLKGRPVQTIHHVKGENSRDYIIERGYSQTDQLLFLIDGKGDAEQKITRYLYNSLGQKSSIIKPDGSQVCYTYDKTGRLKNLSADHVSYSYEYDLLSHPVKVTDINGQNTLRTYDPLGRLQSETLSSGLSTCYSYDLLDRITAITLPDSTSIEYHYDPVRLREIVRNGKSYAYEEFDASGRLTKGLGIVYTYDPAGQLTHWEKDSFYENLSYDPLGNIISKDSNLSSSLNYTYDDLYQLTSDEDNTYSYDSIHNRVSKNGSPYQLNGINQLLSTKESSFHYDLNGNLIEKNGTLFTYDGLDRLIKVETSTSIHEYTYDELNRRLSHNDTQYLYVNENEVGSVSLNGSELRILGLGKGAEIGASVAFEINGETYEPLHNSQGSVIALLQNSSLIESYPLTSFGENFASSINPWGFLSKRHDPETGFVNFGRRYYDPETGRWITSDPLGFAAGPNLYAYCVNSPLTHIDLYGLLESSLTERSFFSRVSSFCSSFTSGFSRAGSCIGSGARWALSQIGSLGGSLVHNLVPHIPILKDAAKLPFHLLQHGTLANYTPTWKETHSGWIKVDGIKSTKGTSASLNGIMTSYDEVNKRGLATQNEIDGHEHYEFYVAEHGAVSDLLQSGMEFFNIPTHASQEFAKGLIELSKNRELNPDYEIKICAFSRGNLVVQAGTLIAQRTVPDIASMIDYTAIGSPKISNIGFKAARYALGDKDGVCTFAHIQWTFGNRNNVHILSLKSALPLIDHGYNNKKYAEFRNLYFNNSIKSNF